jgi:hypothetical protein
VALCHDVAQLREREMADYVYVDNSNLYIEGRRVAAVQQGLAENIQEAMAEGILDQGYTISFGKLHEFLCGQDKREIKRVALFGSRPPPKRVNQTVGGDFPDSGPLRDPALDAAILTAGGFS